MAIIAPSARRALGTFLGLALVLGAVGMASPAGAVEDVEPQAICEDTGWVRTNSWLGEYISPEFYAGGYTNIQFKVIGGWTYKRTYRDCHTAVVSPGHASYYRHYVYYPGQPSHYTKWVEVTKHCPLVMDNRLWGYNYGAAKCNYWYR